jgi:glutathione S-transferase
MKLYGFPMSPNTQRARFALEELGVPYEFVPVDLMSGEHRKPEYLAINPGGRVPTLVEEDFVLFESNAILVYLAARHEGRKLEGDTPRSRAEVARWMFLGCAHLGPAVQQIFAHTMRLPPEKRLPQVVETARGDLDRSLAVLEQQLAKNDHLAGESFTIADISVAPILSPAAMLGIDLTRFPSVSAWLARIKGRPAWAKATGM